MRAHTDEKYDNVGNEFTKIPLDYFYKVDD